MADPPASLPASSGLEVSGGVIIPENELVWRFGPSGGPGGQHANTANTRAELVFEIDTSTALSETQRQRLTDRYGARIRVVSDEHRSQVRNREVALSRMTERINEALKIQRRRRPTNPSRRAKERRLQAKRQRSDTKVQRRRPDVDG